MKFSIIVPIYNMEKYLRQCLDSILNQTLKDFEVICINDGSTDNSLEILKEYQKNDSRIVIVNQKNQGQGIARNEGIKISKGQYILFIDPDDWILEDNAFEQLYDLADKNKAQIVQFNYKEFIEEDSSYQEINLANKIFDSYEIKLENGGFFCPDNLKDDWFLNIPILITMKCYESGFVKEKAFSFAKGRYGEDHLFIIPSTIEAQKIYYLDKYVYSYRIRQDSCCHKKTDDAFDFFDTYKKIEKKLKQDNLYKQNIDFVNNYRFWVCASVLERTFQDKIEDFSKKMKLFLKNQKEYAKYCYKLGIPQKVFFWEKIFSISYSYVNDEERKTICVLGIKIKIK